MRGLSSLVNWNSTYHPALYCLHPPVCPDLLVRTVILYGVTNRAGLHGGKTITSSLIKSLGLNQPSEPWTILLQDLPGSLLEEDHFCLAVNETWQRPGRMLCSTKHTQTYIQYVYDSATGWAALFTLLFSDRGLTLLYGWLHTIFTLSHFSCAVLFCSWVGPKKRTRFMLVPLRLSVGDIKEDVTKRT